MSPTAERRPGRAAAAWHAPHPAPPRRSGPVPGRAGRRRLAALLAAALLAGCVQGSLHDEGEPDAHANWSVTAWGERYEVFPEVAPLVAGEAAPAHLHVTVLDGFEPLAEGTVEIVLRGGGSGPGGGEHRFGAAEPARPGVFEIEVRPAAAGDYDLAFRVVSAAGEEEVRGGRVRVGTAAAPGGVVVAPAPRGAPGAGEPIEFLKEEQWRSDFATAWVRRGRLAASVTGLARVRPPAGGEATVTSPVDGVVRPERWPHPGRRVGRGETLFLVVPGVAADRSLPALEGELAAAESELGAARQRLARLEELLPLAATSVREVEEARARAETLAARRAAAARDLEGARSARQGGAAGSLAVRAPFAGEIAAVTASPGSRVAAGEPLARLVATDRVWLEVAAAPAAARALAAGRAAEAITGVVVSLPEGPSLRLTEGVRLVSVAPEVDPRTGSLGVLVEVPAAAGLVLGTTAEAEILLAAEREGVVVPASAVIDDGGVPVVYLQLSGERFVRQEAVVVERQGERVLVEALVPGQRLVTRGGDALRRSSLVAGGDSHGHLH